VSGVAEDADRSDVCERCLIPRCGGLAVDGRCQAVAVGARYECIVNMMQPRMSILNHTGIFADILEGFETDVVSLEEVVAVVVLCSVSTITLGGLLSQEAFTDMLVVGENRSSQACCWQTHCCVVGTLTLYTGHIADHQGSRDGDQRGGVK
jgi:hypothetical protein